MKHISRSLFFIFFSLLASKAFSQPLTKGEFRHLFTQGNLMMLEGYYDTAVKVFLKLNTNDPSNANVNYKAGCCYLHIPGKRAKAVPYLENAIKQTSGAYHDDEPSEKNAPEDAIYYLGQAYHYAYRFDDAITQFAKFRDIIGKWNLNLVKEIDHWTEISKNAKSLTANPVKCSITNMGDSINSEFAEYSPVISADESVLSFTSRKMGTGGAANKTINDDFYEDIWTCNQGAYGTWTKAKGITAINTEGNEATIGLSADGQELYVYRDDDGDGNIYVSKLGGEFWDPPVKLDINNVNSKKWEPSACVSADGNTMYFVSDREGGEGGRDIYQCHLLPNKTWSEPENLGPTINTPYDEDAPFIHPDGITFFFSSTGHNSIGGFDVFYSTKVSNKVWTTPINMGYPINTTEDDIYFVTSSDGRRAYYASFRPEGKGEKDIYMVSLPTSFVKPVAILVGYLKNRDGSPIPKSSLVTTKSKDGQGQVFTSKPNEATGKFIQSLLPGRSYEITIETNHNKIFADTFFLPEDSSYQNLGRAFFQKTIFTDDTAHLFSTKKILDLTKTREMVPMEGTILFSKDTQDHATHVTVQLLNSQGNILASAVTDDKGKFKFENIPSDQKYLLKIDEKDTTLKTHNQFYLANEKGNIIMASEQEGKFFLFKNISPELNKLSSISNPDSPLPNAAMAGVLTTDEKGKNGLGKATVVLSDDKGKVLQQKTTDPTGHFSFENLASDNNYTISIKDNDPSLLNKHDIFLVNQLNALIRKADKRGQFFVFTNLPTDLNKLSTLELADDITLVAMKGKVLKSTNPKDGIANLNVTLVTGTGKIIQKTKTDTSGAFKFENLSADNNYTVNLDENDPPLALLDRVYLANESDKIVKIIELHKKQNAFKNLPPDLMKLAEMKDVYLTSAIKKDSVLTIFHKNAMYPGDEKFDFVVYFPYNKKEINISVGSFVALMDKVAKTISDNGKATIIIASSSSSVPTKSFPSNEALAESRGNEIKDKVRASMSLKNLDDSKLSYDISPKVLGPEYKNDAVQNRKEYEKWQFVKVIVR